MFMNKKLLAVVTVFVLVVVAIAVISGVLL